MDEIVSFGSWLRQRRKALDLTQAALAARVGVVTSTIEKIEAELRRPSQHTAARLAAALAIPADQQPAFVAWARGRVPADARFVGPHAPVQLPQAGGRPGTVPLERTSFVGRDRELDAVRRLLGANRLVTLTGTGGTGKTRLALRLAAELAGAFPDGVWLVNLASLHEETLVPQAIATTLGLRAVGGRSIEDTLLAWLRERRLLLLLDNCEHLIVACARLADAMLQLAPELRLLTTSREALNIAGEAVFVVPPLGLPSLDTTAAIDEVLGSDAVRLFVERRRSRPVRVRTGARHRRGRGAHLSPPGRHSPGARAGGGAGAGAHARPACRTPRRPLCAAHRRVAHRAAAPANAAGIDRLELRAAERRRANAAAAPGAVRRRVDARRRGDGVWGSGRRRHPACSTG